MLMYVNVIRKRLGVPSPARAGHAAVGSHPLAELHGLQLPVAVGQDIGIVEMIGGALLGA
ncbi:hypothetical protein C6366_00465 [Desulfonatronum sp. SC1]|nr:hypothetical protein C6366_00465 [Desulfonatronum sp. SC1]